MLKHLNKRCLPEIKWKLFSESDGNRFLGQKRNADSVIHAKMDHNNFTSVF
jgi:hypothetical protein